MARRERLDELLDARDLEAVWFARPASFAWLTGGNNVVNRESDVGIAAAGYDGDGIDVVTNNIEADRLRAEELPEDVDVTAFDWHASSLGATVADRTPTPAAADFDVPGLETVDASSLRQPLSAADVDRYRALGEEAARAVEGVCREMEPEDTERQVAAALQEALGERGIDAPVALVGGADRARRYRHCTPQDVPVGEYALASVTAVRHGLHASVTRAVAFDPPEWLRERHAAAMRVETTALAATQAVAASGGPASDVFAEIRTAYDRVGHPDEWKRHHQGGAAGYAGREWIATPTLDAPVRSPMAYAWNPTVQGAKSEDTVLVTEESATGDRSVDDGFEVLTETGDWPTRSVEAVGRDVTLSRHAVLDR